MFNTWTGVCSRTLRACISSPEIRPKFGSTNLVSPKKKTMENSMVNHG